MTWITIIPPQQADPALAAIYGWLYQLYPPEYRTEVPAVERADGTADSIVAAHSLLPEVMRHIMGALGCALQSDLPLTRRQHEMIATVVSAQNRCSY